MVDKLCVVDIVTKEVLFVEPISFADMGIAERQDLQEWVLRAPDLLCERLLVINTEFRGFDKSNRRIDILALDENGALVVVELKLEAFGSHADLQALRYAAFCSTMTMSDVVTQFRDYKQIEETEARRTICTFLDVTQLPELDKKPRIIIAAGSLDDVELTSTVLWLRTYGVDISCVEIVPYRLPDYGKCILVPRILIPLPEARDYIVKVELKEASRPTESDPVRHQLLACIRNAFIALKEPYNPGQISKNGYVKVRMNHSCIHYEWVYYTRDNELGVELHFESDSEQENEQWLASLMPSSANVTQSLGLTVKSGPWKSGSHWRFIAVFMPLDCGDIPAFADKAAKAMQDFIRCTMPYLKPILERR